MFDQLDEYGLWLAAVAGGMTALGWLTKKAFNGGRRAFRWARAFVRKMDALGDVAHYQLNNNGGGSLLDKIERTERKVDQLSGTVTELAGSFDKHLATQAEANRAMWPAVQAVAEAHPPHNEE